MVRKIQEHIPFVAYRTPVATRNTFGSNASRHLNLKLLFSFYSQLLLVSFVKDNFSTAMWDNGLLIK